MAGMERQNETRLKFCKGDMIVILFIFFLAIFVGVIFKQTVGDKEGTRAVIYLDGKPIREISLELDDTIEIKNKYSNQVEIKDGKVRVSDSDCPGRDCVHSGWISQNGQSIVCLPNRVEIRIRKETEGEADFIVR